MARPVSLAVLRDRLRWRTDTQNELTRFPDAELNDCINEGIANFHAEVLRCRGQGFGETQTTITTAYGVQVYPLPAAALEVAKVWMTINSAERVLRTYEEFETDGLVEPVSFETIIDPSYRITGDNISI